MNKQTKGAIAAGAAALLLAGGAGTMAAWNSSASVGGGTVNSGSLTLTADAAGPTWKFADNTAYNPATDKLVPGDVVNYTAKVKVGATGKNIKATLVADPATITGTNGLDTALTKTVTADVNGTALPTGPGGAEITSAQNGQDVNVHVQFTFPASTAGTAAQDGTVNLSGFNVTLTQHQ